MDISIYLSRQSACYFWFQIKFIWLLLKWRAVAIWIYIYISTGLYHKQQSKWIGWKSNNKMIPHKRNRCDWVGHSSGQRPSKKVCVHFVQCECCFPLIIFAQNTHIFYIYILVYLYIKIHIWLTTYVFHAC